jgi:hypothetical protein
MDPGGLSALRLGTTRAVITAPRAMSVTALVVCLTGAGCGTKDDERSVGAITDRFYSALRANSGDRACAQLSTNASKALESASGSSCAEAITKLKLPGVRSAHSTVYLDSARAEVAGAQPGEAAFLDRTALGWRISAAGCTPKGDGPYDCELEG